MGSGDETAKYLHVRQIASGGMGSVELALRRERGFQRLYALKRLHPQFRDDPEFRDMFMDEARVAGLLHHPNVVPVLDVGQDDDGPFLVMEYVRGVSLSTLIRSVSKAGDRMPLRTALELVGQAARGLHAAHELRLADGRETGLVHRDVSPQNILIGFDGIARVTDFGIAKAIGRQTRTSTGILKGKLGYMAPEQLQFREPDRRSDLFALGVVLYECLTGRRLYSGGTEGARRILEEPPPDIGAERDDVPPALVELLLAMLAKKPEHRPQTALAVVERIEVVLEELAFLERTPPLTRFLDQRFGEARDALEREDSERLRQLADGSLSPSAPVEAADDAETIASQAPVDPSSVVPIDRSRHRWSWAIAIGAMVAVAGAVTWFAGNTTAKEEETIEADGPVEAATPPPARPVELLPAEEPSPLPAAQANGASTTAPEEEAEEAERAEEAEEEPPTRERVTEARRRRRPRPRRAPQAAPPTEMAPPPEPPSMRSANPLAGLTSMSF